MRRISVKPRTKALVGGAIVCAISIYLGMFVPSLASKTGMESILANSSELTALTLASCGWWWVVPAALSVVLLVICRGREQDDAVFTLFYWGFVLLMMVMMILVIGGLMLPMMQMTFARDQL